MEARADLAGLRAELMGRVQAMMALCGDYRSTLSQYSCLYTEDRKEALGQFLLYGRVLTAEEVEAHAEDGIPENPPLLHQFRAQIDSYATTLKKIIILHLLSFFLQRNILHRIVVFFEKKKKK